MHMKQRPEGYHDYAVHCFPYGVLNTASGCRQGREQCEYVVVTDGLRQGFSEAGTNEAGSHFHRPAVAKGALVAHWGSPVGQGMILCACRREGREVRGLVG